MIRKITFLPRNFALDNTKAAIAETITYNAVVTMLINRLLKIYRDNGTCRFESKSGSDR